METDKYIGYGTDERCPQCGMPLLKNQVGDKWCSFVECDWSNNPEITEFIRGLSKTTTNKEPKND